MSNFINPNNLNNQNNNNINTQPNLLFYMESCKTCNVFINLAQKSNILKLFKMVCIDGQIDKFKNKGLKKVPTIILTSLNKQFDGKDCIVWLEDMIKINLSTPNLFKNEELNIPDIENKSNHLNLLNNKNSNINVHVSQISNQINQLSSQLAKEQVTTKNQFQVSKSNTIKRNNLVAIQPPGMQLNNNSNQNSLFESHNNLTRDAPIVKPVNQLFGYMHNEMSGFSDGYAYVNVDNPLPKSFLPPDKDMEIYTAPEGDKIDKKKQDQMLKLVETNREEQKNVFSQVFVEINNKIAMGDRSVMPKWINSNPDL